MFKFSILLSSVTSLPPRISLLSFLLSSLSLCLLLRPCGSSVYGIGFRVIVFVLVLIWAKPILGVSISNLSSFPFIGRGSNHSSLLFLLYIHHLLHNAASILLSLFLTKSKKKKKCNPSFFPWQILRHPQFVINQHCNQRAIANKYWICCLAFEERV